MQKHHRKVLGQLRLECLLDWFSSGPCGQLNSDLRVVGRPLKPQNGHEERNASAESFLNKEANAVDVKIVVAVKFAAFLSQGSVSPPRRPPIENENVQRQQENLLVGQLL